MNEYQKAVKQMVEIVGVCIDDKPITDENRHRVLKQVKQILMIDFDSKDIYYTTHTIRELANKVIAQYSKVHKDE